MTRHRSTLAAALLASALAATTVQAQDPTKQPDPFAAPEWMTPDADLAAGLVRRGDLAGAEAALALRTEFLQVDINYTRWRLAEVAFLRGEVAMKAARFTDAARHYRLAAATMPVVDGGLGLEQVRRDYLRLAEQAEAAQQRLEEERGQ